MTALRDYATPNHPAGSTRQNRRHAAAIARHLDRERARARLIDAARCALAGLQTPATASMRATLWQALVDVERTS